jgi:hypothetical protein
MIAIGSGASLDERVGLAALDTFQSIAYIETNKNTRTTDFLGESSNRADFRYTAARARDAMEQEGVASGALQSVIQESMFRGRSQLIYRAVDAVNNRLGTNQRKAGNAAATIAAEVLGTVASLSFARGKVEARTDAGTYVPDRIGDILRDFSAEVWKNVEKAQMEMNDPEYEVVDSTTNQQLDFDVSAVPSELEQNIETGWVVLDEDNNNLNVDSFDNGDQVEAALMSGV